MDPNNPLVVWVGTGENNSQRSVAYGDGVYKSVDGGTTWNNMGLKTSEHIAKIVIDTEALRRTMAYVGWSSLSYTTNDYCTPVENAEDGVRAYGVAWRGGS